MKNLSDEMSSSLCSVQYRQPDRYKNSSVVAGWRRQTRDLRPDYLDNIINKSQKYVRISTMSLHQRWNSFIHP